jgi:hypothetical protein
MRLFRRSRPLQQAPARRRVAACRRTGNEFLPNRACGCWTCECGCSAVHGADARSGPTSQGTGSYQTAHADAALRMRLFRHSRRGRKVRPYIAGNGFVPNRACGCCTCECCCSAVRGADARSGPTSPGTGSSPNRACGCCTCECGCSAVPGADARSGPTSPGTGFHQTAYADAAPANVAVPPFAARTQGPALHTGNGFLPNRAWGCCLGAAAGAGLFLESRNRGRYAYFAKRSATGAHEESLRFCSTGPSEIFPGW